MCSAETTKPDAENEKPKGNGSVAHQIIGEFLDSLDQNQEFAEVAKRLRTDIFSGKPTEATLRYALFGEDEL